MNIDIQTEHVGMRPEWHHAIDTWVDRCRRYHPDVVGIDLHLRHGPGHPEEEVDVVAFARGRSLRAVRHADGMAEALHDALDTLEHELLVHEAIERRA